ncbi:coiled-coil domain-containing protein 175 [Tenrec ecaudatus]|uniref:coiled-coil domain-containing protein 175 n=1 Tax=Tenrec ecaudatus TaxID=94439 RepID=UPI003F5A922E
MSLSPCGSDLEVRPKSRQTATKRAMAKNTRRAARLSTGRSLELSTAPPTLGCGVATNALRQLFVVEKSLQSDYFKCDEQVRNFLKGISEAVKKLEEMRKSTIDRLEIETMELSRLYFLLETLPSCFSRELEECVRDARKLNLFEINKLHMRNTTLEMEIESLKKKIVELKGNNISLGEKQEELAKKHERSVVLFNHILERKAATIIFINDTYTKINLEKEEIEAYRSCLEETKTRMEMDREEYLLMKKRISVQMDEYKRTFDKKRMETYGKKKELTKLTLKVSKMKETVASRVVVSSDHNLEIAQLHGLIREWEEKVGELQKISHTLEDKIKFFDGHKEKLDTISTVEKEEFLQKIKQMAENLHKARGENKELQDKLVTLARQYQLVLSEEDEFLYRKRKIKDENERQLEFISQKDNFLAQRRVDIKNMEEGLITLQELHRAIQEVYRKQIKVMGDNIERENQRSIITQWKIACLLKTHSRWKSNTKTEIQEIKNKIEKTQIRKIYLYEETNTRQKEIDEFLAQIEKLTEELKQEEEEFISTEKQLIEEINIYEDQFVKEAQINREKEDELQIEYRPQLYVAEEMYLVKCKRFQELVNIITAQKNDENLLSNNISQLTRDFSRYIRQMDMVKRDVQYLREQESTKLKEHFEFLKNLENEIYAHDFITELLLTENEKLKAYISCLKKKTEGYKARGEGLARASGDQSWTMIVQHKKYMKLWAEFKAATKVFMDSGKQMMQEINDLIEKLSERDEKIERIGSWLQGNLSKLSGLREWKSSEELERKRERPSKRLHFQMQCSVEETN